MRRAVVRAVMAAVLIVLVLAPSQAAAFPLTTCQLALQSTDANNVAIDTAAGGAPDSTSADPFKVDWEGSVSYKGTTTVVIKNYTYGIAVFGVPTPLQGGGTNDAENTEGDGTVGVAANSTLPFKITGLYYVSGRYSGEGGTCTGSGWFLLLGDPIGTIPWLLGLGSTVLGALGLVAGVRGHAMTGVVGGLVLGIGVDLLLITSATLPLAENTPLAGLIGGAVLGVVAALAGRVGKGRGKKGEEPAAAPG